MKTYDAIVIGSGITGSCTARELAKYDLKIAVLEKSYALCAGATRTNSATVHSGHDALNGSLKAYYNVRGNAMYDKLCADLDVKFNRNGTILFCLNDADMETAKRLKENADRNGVPNVQVLTREELNKLPDGEWGDDVVGAMYAPSGGMVCPYTLTFAICENAADNGVDFYLNTPVTDIKKVFKEDGRTVDGYVIKTSNKDEEEFFAKYVFNCAGVYADVMNNFVSEEKIEIRPRKGSHIILDKKLAPYVHSTWVQAPYDLPDGGHTKGMGIMPSVDGTIILGCEAVTMQDKDDTTSYADGRDHIINYCKEHWHSLPIAKYYPEFPQNMIITCIAGNRPHSTKDDFILGEPNDAPGFINEAGIESPGLTAGPAIALDLVTNAAEKYGFTKNDKFNPIRKAIRPFREMSDEEKAAAIAENPDYGQIICRCEQITKAEVLDAIRRPLGAKSVSGVKMRIRAGMGRCQGGFCSPEVVKILSEELGIPMTEVLNAGEGSEVLVDET